MKAKTNKTELNNTRSTKEEKIIGLTEYNSPLVKRINEGMILFPLEKEGEDELSHRETIDTK
jgi:hypothetical protein